MKKTFLMLGFAVLLVGVAGGSNGCGDDDLPPNAPSGHTVNEDGVAHADGHRNPTANCVDCHGADLRGGSNGEPSCFSCHGQEW